jgi:transposase InsO family protein
MADRVVGMDVRALVVAWSAEAPRGAVARFCREHGVSRSWFYEVRARARSEDVLSALQPRPRLVRMPHATPVEVEDLAVRVRKELADSGLDHGPVTVRWHLQQLGVTAPAASTLARIFVRHGMVVAQPDKRPHAATRRFQAGAVHECWQLDAFDWVLADGTPASVLQVLDDRCRFLLASRAAPGETSQAAIEVVAAAIAAHQVPIRLLSDNGTAFNVTRRGHTGRLVTYLQSLGCRPITGRPAPPQTQGKNERVHQTTQRWLHRRPRAGTLSQLQAQLDDFDQTYNHHRPHQSLGMRTPAQAMADGPYALPPASPPPTTTNRELISAPTTTAKTYKVCTNGNLRVARVTIQLGWENAATKVTVVRGGEHVDVFDHRGNHIRSVHLQPGQTYYSNGRPRGGRHHKRQVSTLR